MKYVFYDKDHNQYIGEAKDIIKAMDLFEDTLNTLDIQYINCMVFENDADIEHDQPDHEMTGEQFKKRADIMTGFYLTEVKSKDNDQDIKPLSQDRAGILKNLSIEEQAYVIGRVPDQMLLDELNMRMHSYNSTLDKILGNIKGLEVRI